MFYKHIIVNSDYGLCWLVELDDGDCFKKTIKPIMHGPSYDRWSFGSFLFKQRGFQEKKENLETADTASVGSFIMEL